MVKVDSGIRRNWMIMISFENKLSLNAVEDAYADLRVLDGDSTLRLPATFQFGGSIGLPAAVIQFVATWARSNPESTLKLYGQAGIAGVQSFAGEPHGMVALYFSERMKDAIGENIAVKDALTSVIPRIEAMQSGRYIETMHGRGAFLCCFGGAANEYLLPFYTNPNGRILQSRDSFVKLTARLVAACAPAAERGLTDAHRIAIGTLVYELFKNTHEHASTDEFGNSYSRNVRAVMAKFVSLKVDSGSGQVNAEDPAHSFFLLHNLANKRLREDENGRKRASPTTDFLELTVLDTGPGLVRRWLSKHRAEENVNALSIDEELHYVQRCFEEHTSTKEVRASGVGLPYVVKTLNQLKGFLRLRTGRVCLVQDFSSGKNNKFMPKHWRKERPELPLTSGAAYSLIIPLSRNQ